MINWILITIKTNQNGLKLTIGLTEHGTCAIGNRKDCRGTKVNGQPTRNNLDLLDKELTAIAASIPTVLGGRLNGHAGMLLSDANYATIALGTPFVPPANPGVYPIGVTAANCVQIEAEHKEQIKVFETFTGVGMGLKDLILKAMTRITC